MNFTTKETNKKKKTLTSSFLMGRIAGAFFFFCFFILPEVCPSRSRAMASGDGVGLGMTIQNDWHASFALSESLKESDFWVSAIAQDDNQKVQAKSYFSTQVCCALLFFDNYSCLTFDTPQSSQKMK